MPDGSGKQYNTTKDSGRKQEFDTGAHRDTQEGKGRYDLIPPVALKRLAGVYERGAAKYGQRNWEKGMPIGRYLDSALRHVYQYIEGRRDEDHLAQAFWNLAGAMHTETMIDRGILPEKLNDMPNHLVPKADPLPPGLSAYIGKPVTRNGSSGRIIQLSSLTPPDDGIAVDVQNGRDGMCEGWHFASREELDAAVSLAEGGG